MRLPQYGRPEIRFLPSASFFGSEYLTEARDVLRVVAKHASLLHHGRLELLSRAS